MISELQSKEVVFCSCWTCHLDIDTELIKKPSILLQRINKEVMETGSEELFAK